MFLHKEIRRDNLVLHIQITASILILLVVCETCLYDNKPNTINIGVGFDWQELEPTQWARQPHDQALTVLLTESGVHQ